MGPWCYFASQRGVNQTCQPSVQLARTVGRVPSLCKSMLHIMLVKALQQSHMLRLSFAWSDDVTLMASLPVACCKDTVSECCSSTCKADTVLRPFGHELAQTFCKTSGLLQPRKRMLAGHLAMRRLDSSRMHNVRHMWHLRIFHAE